MRYNNKVGKVYINKQGLKMEIIEYFGCNNCAVQFEDGVILKNIQYGHIKEGVVKNPNHPSVYGVGYLGVGKYTNKTHPEIYKKWAGILQRSYSDKYQKNYQTYKNCFVIEDWKCFQNFAKWYEDNWKPYMQGWELDKDIFVKGNIFYSQETCCFVPHEINSLFVKSNKVRGKYPIGVTKADKKYKARFHKKEEYVDLGRFNTPEEAFQAYKTAKEKYIKEVADEWKTLISIECHHAMYNYKIEITD